jgi:hypothetical protein
MADKKSSRTEISNDGKTLTFFDSAGTVRWARQCPSAEEWELTRISREDIENGTYFYAGGEVNGLVVAVFTPRESLDFTITFCANSGKVICVKDAR